MSISNFYRAFEDRYRGSRELILGRLKVYLPFVTPLLSWHAPAAKALDLGCGRGEWLQLMQEAGFEVHGVDLDEDMLQACRERNLPVTHGDAIGFLREQATASLSVISGFHVAEHIRFEQLLELEQEALRALQPGGLLILETPNPENVVVGTANFYLDPTHQQPIPPLLLEFLPQHIGFNRTKILRLQEPAGTAERDAISLRDVLHDVSPDYAVVAQKAAPAELMQALDAVFSQPYGVDLATLASRYDARHEGVLSAHHHTRQDLNAAQQQIAQHQSTVQNLQHSIAEHAPILKTLQQDSQALHAHLQTMQRSLLDTHTQVLTNLHQLQANHAQTGHVQGLLDASQAQAHHLSDRLHEAQTHLLHLQAALQSAQAERDAFRNSVSWRVTSPLRGGLSLLKAPLQFIMGKVLQNPDLSARLNKVIVKIPPLHARLRNAAITQGMMSAPVTPPVIAPHLPTEPTDVSALSPRARQFHAALEQARKKP